MTNPPAAVKLALESICLLLGEETNDWKKIRQVIIRDNFISSIVNFSSEEMRYWCHDVGPTAQNTVSANQYHDLTAPLIRG